MTQERLVELFRKGFASIKVDHDQSMIDKFLFYLQEIVKWNSKINLTGHKNEQQMIGSLFIDSVACTRVFGAETSCSILDIGSGAGFPGIPIGIVSPLQDITLLEPNLKKVAFLHHMIGSLGLHNVHVESCRIEQFSEKREFQKKFDWAFAKALRFDVGYVIPLLSDSGKCVFSRTKPIPHDFQLEGYSVIDEIPYELPFGLGKRILSIAGKRGDDVPRGTSSTTHDR